MNLQGFEFIQRTCGAGPTIKNVLGKGTISLTKGDLVCLDAGELTLAVANGTAATTNILGVCLETKAAAVAHRFPVIIDDDAVYGVTDASVRKIGDPLDISGTITGGQGVTTASHKEFVVVEDSTAAEPTKVRVNVGHHHYNTAQ